MKNKKQCIQNTEDENRDNTEAGEDNEENSSSSFNIFTDEADRCPICLNCLAEQEVGFPENCTHIFCVTCILKWAETRASCPVDRKQFQAVYKLSVVKDFIKVQIKQQVSKKDDLLSCNEGKYCPMNMKSFTRKQENEVRKPLTAIFWKGWNQKCGSSDNEDKNAALMKKNKPRRQTCSNRFFRSNSCNRSFSSSSSTGESPNHRNECIEISKIDTSVERKRRELELSGSVLARAERIPSMCYEMETFLRVPTVAVGALFPIDTTPLENFGSSVKGYAVTYVQEGEEKKQTSGTAGTRGTRRKISDNTPRRRSARNTKTETASQSQTSPKSSSSGCEASGDGSSFVNASCAESEKLPPKRKAKRAVKQQEPLVKKKLRSYGRCRKPPGDLVEEGDSETEATVLLDKGHLPDTEKGTSDFSQKSDVELQSVNGLENSTDLVKCKELPEDSCKGLDTSEMLDMDPCVQEPPVLTPERETEKCDVAEDTEFQSERHYISAAELIDQPPHLSGEELSEDTVTLPHLIRELDNSETELPGKVELVAIADKPLDSSGDRLALGAESVAVVDEPLPNPENELQEVLKCVESEKQLMSGPENELLGRSESVAVTDEVLDSTGNEKPEEPLAGHCSHSGSSLPEESVVGEDQPLGSPRSKLLELQVSLEMEAPETEEKEASTLGDNEDQKYTDLLMNIASGNKCDQSLEEVREASRMSVSPTTHAEDVKHFSEDNNDIVAMECDSFSSDQNDTHIDQPVESGIVEQEADSLLHEMEHSVSFTSLEKREESECSGELKKEKKPRTRRSRFHSPSTTWSPSMREGRKSQSPSPERTTVAEGRMSRSPRKEIVTEGRVSQSPKGDISKEGQRSLSQSPKRDLLTKRKKSLSQSPKRDQMREGRSLSQSPRREPQREGRSRSQSPKKDLLRGERRSLSQSPKRDLLREGRRSPSCSPKRDGSREKRRSSRTRAKDSSPRHKCRSQSRDRDSDKEGPRRDHGRERGRRRWSQSRSRSRSRSRQRNKGPSFPRNERESYSPPRWKERWTNDNWRSPRGNDRYKRNEQDKLPENLKRERDSTDKDSDIPLDPDQYKKDYPDWVMERINSVPESKNREREKFKGPAWEENRQNNSGPPWNRNFGSSWNSNRGRGGRNRGGRGRGGFLYGDQSENRWQPWKPHSGNTNSTGNESSRYPEHQPYKRKSEQDFSFDTPADRSGWTSASSWAVRKTLPADVQNYYSRRGRTSPSPQSAWTRPEEAAAPEQDPNFKDQTSQQGDNSQLPINIMQPQMNVMTPVNTQHQPMNIFPYPMGVHAPMMNIQHNPFNLPPPVPMHLHTGVPLVQVATPTNMSQGPPPPPPPPPPSQQVNYVASQLDGKQLQAIPSTSHGLNNMGTPIPPASTAALGSMEAVQGPSSGNTTSSSTIKSSNSAVKLAESKVSVTVEASADSSKKDQKLLIQEKAAQEVKLAIKPFYQNKDISKEEYKEIVRKAVDKVCHSKSGEVNSAKVANLVKAYVDKYKHSRKKNPEEAISMERK